MQQGQQMFGGGGGGGRGRGYLGKNPRGGGGYQGQGGGGGGGSSIGGGYQGNNNRGRGRGGTFGQQGGGRCPRGGRGQQSGANDPLLAVKTCPFFAKDGGCTFGDKCRSKHNLSVHLDYMGHEGPISVMAMHPSGRLFTGSSGAANVKVWNFDGGQGNVPLTPRLEADFPTKGPVGHIQINGEVIMWSAFEPLIESPILIEETRTGVVHLLADPSSGATVKITKSEDIPYTHPLEVSAFRSVVAGENLYVLTGGGEGTIRSWAFDKATSTFKSTFTFEGHVRGITSIAFDDTENKFWSSSLDSTIRVWDVASGVCDGVISSDGPAGSATTGHVGPVNCLKLLPAVADHPAFMLSGGADGALKVWGITNGTLEDTIIAGENAGVTAIEVMSDAGEQAVLVGYSDGRIIILSAFSLDPMGFVENPFRRNVGITSILCPGSKKIIVGGTDSSVIIWNVNSDFAIPR